MQRHALGIIGLLSLVGCAVLFLSNSASSESRFAFMASVLMRVGIVFCLTWLAFPQLESLLKRLPKWAWGMLGTSAMLIIINPKMIPIAIPLVAFVCLFSFVGWLFKPPPNSKAARRQDAKNARSDKS